MAMLKRTFNLKHLTWFVSAACVVLAIFQFSPAIAIAFCPLAIAPPVSHAVSPTRSAIVAGLISAIFWTLLFLIISLLAVFRLGSAYSGDGWLSAKTIAFGALVVTFISTLAGGYLGGRTSTH